MRIKLKGKEHFSIITNMFSLIALARANWEFILLEQSKGATMLWVLNSHCLWKLQALEVQQSVHIFFSLALYISRCLTVAHEFKQQQQKASCLSSSKSIFQNDQQFMPLQAGFMFPFIRSKPLFIIIFHLNGSWKFLKSTNEPFNWPKLTPFPHLICRSGCSHSLSLSLSCYINTRHSYGVIT